MLENHDEILTRLNILLRANVFDVGISDFDDTESLNRTTQDMAVLLRDIYMELKEIKKSLKTEQLPSCEFDQA